MKRERVVVEKSDIYICYKSCCYYKECGGFREKTDRCPKWTMTTPIKKFKSL